MQNSGELKRLLVATDLSPRCTADSIGRCTWHLRTEQFTVLHVADDDLEPKFANELIGRARQRLAQQVSEAAESGGVNVDIRVKTRIDEGKVIQEVRAAAGRGERIVEVRIEGGSTHDLILEQAKADHSDLILCGVQRYAG